MHYTGVNLFLLLCTLASSLILMANAQGTNVLCVSKNNTQPNAGSQSQAADTGVAKPVVQKKVATAATQTTAASNSDSKAWLAMHNAGKQSVYGDVIDRSYYNILPTLFHNALKKHRFNRIYPSFISLFFLFHPDPLQSAKSSILECLQKIQP